MMSENNVEAGLSGATLQRTDGLNGFLRVDASQYLISGDVAVSP